MVHPRQAVDLGTSHLAENIFEVPREQGHVGVFVKLWPRLAPTQQVKPRHSALATNREASPGVLSSR